MIEMKFHEEKRRKTPYKAFWGMVLISFVLILPIFLPNSVLGQNEIKLLPSDGVFSDKIGNSVALSANGVFALIGAPEHDTVGEKSGIVYMFTQDGVTWSYTEDWSRGASDGMPEDQFGFSIALGALGEYILIGAPYHFHPLIDERRPALKQHHNQPPAL